eukprot:NODE_90_length_21577_cov_0.697691.p11 type:complete len:238 gc:universal NODE_90_length_21577_cov_0.697691:11418-10705(-)
MFYTSHLIGDGSLSLIWLAAHNTKSIKKKEAVHCDIDTACKDIISGSFALRLSAYLLLGLHKLYEKQAAFLLNDCTVATDRSMFGKRKKEKHMPQLDFDLSEGQLQIDDDQLLESISLSAKSLPSIEINRGIDLNDEQLNFDLSLGNTKNDDSIEVGRRGSVGEALPVFDLPDNSILPIPLDLEQQLLSEERAHSELKSTQESLPDLQLEISKISGIPDDLKSNNFLKNIDRFFFLI